MGSGIRELKTDKSGQFYRQIGRKVGVAGQAKFRLGADRRKAEWAYLKLGKLWEIVVAEHKAFQTATADFDGAEDTQPVWTDEALTIAEAVRKHLHNVHVGPPDRIRGPAAYATHLDHLSQKYGDVISIVPANAETAKAGKAEHQQFAEHRSRQARLNARIAAIPVPVGVIGVSVYSALDRYAARAVEQTAKESGKVEAANALRLKDSTPDMGLSAFGYTAMERMRNYWTARPHAKLRGGKSTGPADQFDDRGQPSQHRPETRPLAGPIGCVRMGAATTWPRRPYRQP